MKAKGIKADAEKFWEKYAHKLPDELSSEIIKHYKKFLKGARDRHFGNPWQKSTTYSFGVHKNRRFYECYFSDNDLTIDFVIGIKEVIHIKNIK